MDIKLAEYRARKRKENVIKSVKESLVNGVSWVIGEKYSMEELHVQSESDNRPSSPESTDSTDLEDEAQLCQPLTWANFLLYASLWAILYSLAIYMEFGAVYFVLSSLVIIYYNTRTGPKSKDEISAYSVFNKNCESIKGTLKAEQFEKELRYGVLHT